MYYVTFFIRLTFYSTVPLGGAMLKKSRYKIVLSKGLLTQNRLCHHEANSIRFISDTYAKIGAFNDRLQPLLLLPFRHEEKSVRRCGPIFLRTGVSAPYVSDHIENKEENALEVGKTPQENFNELATTLAQMDTSHAVM